MAEKPYHHGDLKHALVDAAVALLREGTGDAISLREVAKRVGVSPNAPYRHFKDKEELIASVAESGFRELTKRFRSVPVLAPKDWFVGLGCAYYAFSQDHPAEFRVMFACWESRSEQSGLVEASGEAFFILLSAIQQLLPPGTTQTQAVPYALATWSLVHGYATLQQQRAFEFIDSSVAPGPEGLAHMMLRAIGSPDSTC